MDIDLNPDMRGFFRDRLQLALDRIGIEPGLETQCYLVDLLAGFASDARRDTLEAPLVTLLAEAAQAPTSAERFRRFREVGDTALYVCGFFSDRIEARGVSRDYVVRMGGRAYGAASDIAQYGAVYEELATKFDPFARVLDDVREMTVMRTPQEIVRLYERWRRTRSPLLAERLHAEGVFPQRDGDKKRVLH